MKTKDIRLDKYKTFFNKGKEAERKRILKIIDKMNNNCSHCRMFKDELKEELEKQQ